jgi:PAS domain-containing protein
MLGRIALRALPQMGLMQAPSGVVIVDTELRIVWVNLAAGRLGDGIPTTRWHGRRLGEVLPEMDADPVEQSLRQVLATGKPAIDLQVSGHTNGDPGGERFWSCTQFRVDGPDGKAAGVTHVMREVTDRVLDQRRISLAD